MSENILLVKCTYIFMVFVKVLADEVEFVYENLVVRVNPVGSYPLLHFLDRGTKLRLF